MKRVALTTLGCKLNQYETWQMAQALGSAEIVPFSQVADLYVINTCTVTKRSDFRSRQLIRQAKKRNPQAKIIATGCYAQTQKEALASLPELDLVIANADKVNILDIVNRILEIPLLPNIDQGPGFLNDYTRAFVKIQDGCNNQCAYCIVRIARGEQISIPFKTVINEVRALKDKGYEEVVLTGIQLGGYGTDLAPSTNLSSLLWEIDKINGLKRLRLSSIEPMDFDDELISTLTSCSCICPHFHIPLQSGDDEILRRMNRSYSVADYRDIVMRLKEKLPTLGLGTDIIVGFPGESDEQFENTVKLVESLPFSYLHVFSFSPRPGTTAADMSGQVMPEIIKQRSQKLRTLSKQKKEEFQKSYLNQTLSVLFEKRKDSDSGLLTGLSDNYIRIVAEDDESHMNKICRVKAEKILDDKLLGCIV